ncbi:MAG: hypothetical protein EPN86_05590 [Nanoarchaeota archaeon]|nr:MAG: hypothetical protein EPN86_05590 [Nanoarchaeota archaeon]
MAGLKQLEDRISRIEKRNRKVELDKSWETSLTRKIILAVLTYIVVLLFFLVAKLPNPYVTSLIPTLGFILSTLSLPIFKDIWMKNRK